jgi:hypothetical protein
MRRACRRSFRSWDENLAETALTARLALLNNNTIVHLKNDPRH